LVPAGIFRYDEFVYAFQKQKADILVAPLCDNLFNSCKSAIKYLEYGAIGVPGIFSRVAPYIDTVEHGKDGFLASTDEDWMDGLVRLIESPELRRELAFSAQEKIRNHWLLSKNVGKRLKIYQDAITNYHPRERKPSSFNVIERSITQQYYEGYSIKNNQLKALKDQLADRDENIRSLNHKIDVDHEHINDLQNEVISYATSFSWKITRPFRAFMRLVRRFFHA
jgi:hypothetical protein